MGTRPPSLVLLLVIGLVCCSCPGNRVLCSGLWLVFWACSLPRGGPGLLYPWRSFLELPDRAPR